jgi:hypothetical protein
MKTMTLLVMSLLLATACGGKSKAKTADPVPVPGDGETGGGYGDPDPRKKQKGKGPSLAGLECESGIPECDAVFKRLIACMASSPDLTTEDQIDAAGDALMAQCDELQKAAGDEAQRAEAVTACDAIAQSGPQLAEKLHCTW